MPPTRSNRQLITWAKRLFQVAVIGLVAWFISGQIRDIYIRWQEDPQKFAVRWPALVLASLLFMASFAVGSSFWWWLIRRLGSHPAWWPTFRAYILGNLAKYVPGKALVVILRVTLLRPHGGEPLVSTIAVFVETLLMMAVGALLAGVTVALLYRDQPLLLWGSLGAILVTAVPLLPPIFRRGLALVGKLTGRWSLSQEKLSAINWSTMAEGTCFMGVNWMLQGLALLTVLNGMGARLSALTDLPWLTSGLALSTVAGFVSGLPGGLGAREVVLGQWLQAGGLPSESGAAVALLMRLLNLLSELILAALIYPFFRRPASLSTVEWSGVDNATADPAPRVATLATSHLPTHSDLPQNREPGQMLSP